MTDEYTMKPTDDYNEAYFTSADGLKLYYREYGEPDGQKLPILCLHGLTRNSSDFHELAVRLADSWRVISADVRGRGRSDYDELWENYHPATYVQDTLMLLESLGIDKAIVIGTSMGGLIAMAMASVRPDVLAGVVLNDIGPELSAEGLTRIMNYVGDVKPDYSYQEAIVRVKELNDGFFPDMDEAGWEAFMLRCFREKESGRYVPDYDGRIFKALHQGAATPEDDLWALFNALQPIPALVLRGELSDLLSEETVGRMKAAKSDLQRCTVQNRGHAPLLDEPDSVAAIEAFLSQYV